MESIDALIQVAMLVGTEFSAQADQSDAETAAAVRTLDNVDQEVSDEILRRTMLEDCAVSSASETNQHAKDAIVRKQKAYVPKPYTPPIKIKPEWLSSPAPAPPSESMVQVTSHKKPESRHGLDKGMTFLSFPEFLQRKAAYSERENMQLIISDAHRLKTDAYDKVSRPYERVTFSCIYMPKKSKSKGVRMTTSRGGDCPVTLGMGFDKKEKVYIIRKSMLEHNHPCSSDTLPPPGRRLPDSVLTPEEIKRRKPLKGTKNKQITLT